MAMKILLSIGSMAAAVGTGLHVNLWFFSSAPVPNEVKTTDVIRWAFDAVAFRPDIGNEHRDILRGRIFRRTRAGWFWLFIGTTVLAIETTVDMILEFWGR
jgi:hypothetical protein